MRIIKELMEIWPNEVCNRQTMVDTETIVKKRGKEKKRKTRGREDKDLEMNGCASALFLGHTARDS